MRISIVINPKAGFIDSELIERKIRDNLFRCDLSFGVTQRAEDVETFLKAEVLLGSEAVVICGGDGTINTCIQPLMVLKEQGYKVPPICIVCSGTANDLANEMGVSKKIDRAVRDIFEGTVKEIDVIQVSSKDRKSYMFTNGGFGLPAQTARKANILRRWIRSGANDKRQSLWKQILFKAGKEGLQLIRSQIYSLILIDDLKDWDFNNWQVEIEFDGKEKVHSEASFIMVNNQTTLGGSFIPAPFTSNTDGTFDVLLLENRSRLSILNSLLEIRRGQEPQNFCSHREVSSMKVKRVGNVCDLSFFGDGEILQENVNECRVDCISPGLPVFVRAQS